MTVVLSLLAAVSWGSGDFLGGVASRYGRATAAAAAVQVVGIGAVAVVAPFIGGSPTSADLAWGAIAGVAGGLGLLFLYRGMVVADMGLVAPIAAIGTAVFPLLFGIATGERPTGLEIAGLALGLIAIWLVSSRSGIHSVGSPAAVLFGLGAGAGFGGLLIGLSRIGEDGGIWPLAPTRLAGAVIIYAIAAAARQPVRPLRAAWPGVLGAGFLGVLGNAFFLFATQAGSLAVAAVVGSLFPAATVLLARVVLREALTTRRVTGLATTVIAIAFISAG